MTSRRLYLLLIGCIGLLIVGLVGGTYGANSLLTTRANKLTGLKAESAALSEEHASLSKAKQEIATYSDLEKIAKAVVPEDKDQAEAVREIVNIAEANGITLSTITFPASTLGATTGTRSSTAPAPAPAPAASGSASAPKTKALSQLTPVKNITGVYTLQIQVASDSTKPVPYSRFINFLSALEHNRRTSQVNTITLDPNKDNSNLLSFTLGLSGYIKP